MPLEHEQHTVTAGQAGRGDLVVKSLTGRSRSQLRGMFLNGCVTINGRKVIEPSTTVKQGDVVEICFDPQCRNR